MISVGIALDSFEQDSTDMPEELGMLIVGTQELQTQEAWFLLVLL